MAITAKDVKALRDQTGAGMMDCKKALQATDGDQKKAIEWLRKKGLSEVSKKASRVAANGSVSAYIHNGGRIGVLLEVNCESDFVAQSEEFKTFAKEVAMQVAAENPDYLDRTQVPAEVIEKEREVHMAAVLASGKPEKIAGKIVDGKINKWLAEICLMDQEWLKDSAMSIEDLRAAVVQKTGENVQVRRFVRFVLGEGIEKKQENLAEEIAKMREAVSE